MKPKELCYHRGLVAHSFSLEDTQQMQVGWSMTQRTVWVLSVLGLAIFAAADTSRAQMRLWEDTGYLNINYLYQAKNRSFQETISQSIYDETATYTATHKIAGGGGFDVGGGYRVWQNLAVGVDVSSGSNRGGLLVEGRIPHPLFYERHRTSTLARTDLDRTELGIHLQAVWVLPVSEVLQVSFFGGPSVFTVGQDHVSDVQAVNEAAETFGPFYDEVTIPGISTNVTLRGSGVGVNAGAEVTYMFTQQLGGGVFGRWASGNVELATSGGTQSLAVGGFQIGAGVRVRF